MSEQLTTEFLWDNSTLLVEFEIDDIDTCWVNRVTLGDAEIQFNKMDRIIQEEIQIACWDKYEAMTPEPEYISPRNRV